MNYQSGFRMETDNQITPGFVCHALACQHYLEQGASEYNLLAGEADYKKRLGEKKDQLTSLVVERPTFRNNVKNALKPLRSFLRG